MGRKNSITNWFKRISSIGILSLASIAAANAQVVPKVPKGIDSCKLLRDAGRGSAVMTHTDYLAAGSRWMSCACIDGPDALKTQWRVRFGFVSKESGAPVAVLPMEALSDLVILRSGPSVPTVVMPPGPMTFTVTNTNDSGSGSPGKPSPGCQRLIRGGHDRFQHPGAGVQTITRHQLCRRSRTR